MVQPSVSIIVRFRGVGVAWLALIAGLAIWLTLVPQHLLRDQLKVLQFWSLTATVLAGLAVGALALREVVVDFDRYDARRLSALAALALILTLFVAPRTNRIYYDEQIYQSVAQNLADTRLAQMCSDGTVEYGRLQCWIGEYNKQPYGYPHLLSLAYRLAGVRTSTAFFVNAFAAAVMVCLLYVLAFLLFGDRDAAFWSGLLLSVMPMQIMWSATAAVEPTASLTAVGALVAAAIFSRSRSTVSLFATAVATAYAVQFRPESFLVIAPVALLCWPAFRAELTRPRLWWAGLAFMVLTAVHFGHSFAVRNEGWGTADARLSLAYVASNLRINGWFYLGDERFPVIVTALAAAGFRAGGFVRERASLIVYFLAFWAIDLLFYAGSYNYGADVRYSLMTYPPLAILGGYGTARVARWLVTRKPDVQWRTVLTAAVMFQFLFYTPLVRATTEEAWAAREDVAFAKSFASSLPANSYVLTHNPGMFHLWRVNAGQMSLVAGNSAYLKHLQQRYTGGVYLHWNFWCNVGDQLQSQFCGTVLSSVSTVLVREHRNRDQRFAFHLLKPPAPKGE